MDCEHLHWPTESPVQDRDAKWALGFIGLVTLVRLAWHGLQPIGIVGDEAYYWTWGQFPDLGYFSKPPLIGWLYGLVDAFFGPRTWAVKATATVLIGACLWFFQQWILLATGDRKVSRWGLMLFALVPANLALASILTIDVPLMVCWTGGAYFSLSLLKSKTLQPLTLAGLVLSLGLGYLAKQMMLVQLPLILILLLVHRRDLLGKPVVWASLLGSLLFLIPPLIWNMQNGWITLGHTAHHFQSGNAGFIPALNRLGEFWGSLAGIISPLVFISVFPAGWFAWQRRRDPQIQFLALFGLIGLTVMSAMTMRQRINANWPAVFMPGTLILITIWCWQRNHHRWLRWCLGTAAVLSLVMMVVGPLLNPLTGLLARHGILPPRQGWLGYAELSRHIAAAAENDCQVVFVGHRFAASQYAFHRDAAHRTYVWNSTGHPHTQFDFYPPPEAGAPALIVVERRNQESTGQIPDELEVRLHGVEPLMEYPMHFARDYPRFKLYRAEVFDGFPSDSDIRK